MISYVKGILVDFCEDNIVLDVNGIGYNVKISASTLEKLPPIGVELKIYTYTLVREDAFMLYGFLKKDDLDIFKKCITVSGIGPKGGLALLSTMDANSLRYAILSGDVKSISKAPGIGKKTAERLILDLKDKISIDENSLHSPMLGTGDDLNEVLSSSKETLEAVEALVALGYGRTEALKAVRDVENASALDTGELLKAALKKLF